MKKSSSPAFHSLLRITGCVISGWCGVAAPAFSSPLSEREVEMERIVVTGQHQPTSLRNSVYRVKVIGRETIRAKAAADLPSLLHTELGIRLTNDLTLGETDLELLGMGGNNLRIMVDGVPLVERGENRQSLGQIDIESVERVEIVEGPMSVMYGSDALAGVVNIITRRIVPDNERNRWGVRGGFREESLGREYDFFHAKGLHKQFLQGSFASKRGPFVEAGYTRNRQGGWTGEKTGREKRWQPKDQDTYAGMIGYEREKFGGWYRLEYLDEVIYNPGNGPQNQPEVVSDKNFKTTRHNHTAHLEWKPGRKLRGMASASFQDYRRTTRSWFTDRASGKQWLSLEDAAQDTTAMKLFFLRTSASWEPGPSLSVLPGIEYRYQKGEGGRLEGSPEDRELSFFLSAEWRPSPKLGVMPGVRSVLISDYRAPALIPALQAKYDPTESMNLRFSYAYGFRAPTLRELWFSFHDASHNIDGNPSLKAEYSHSFRLHYGWEPVPGGSALWNVSVTGFYNDFRDRITLAVDAEDPSHMTYYNVARYKTHGVQWEGAVRRGDFHARAGFLVTGRYNDLRNDGELGGKFGPDFRYSAEMTASATYRLKNTSTEFSFFYKFTGRRLEYLFDLYTSEIYKGGTDGFHWADFTVVQPLCGGRIGLQAGVKNLFDVDTIGNSVRDDPHTSVGGSSLIGCGRSCFLALNVYFNR